MTQRSFCSYSELITTLAASYLGEDSVLISSVAHLP